MGSWGRELEWLVDFIQTPERLKCSLEENFGLNRFVMRKAGQLLSLIERISGMLSTLLLFDFEASCPGTSLMS